MTNSLSMAELAQAGAAFKASMIPGSGFETASYSGDPTIGKVEASNTRIGQTAQTLNNHSAPAFKAATLTA